MDFIDLIIAAAFSVNWTLSENFDDFTWSIILSFIRGEI